MTNPLDALLPAPNVGLAVALNPRALAPGPIPRGVKIALAVVLIVALVGFTLLAACAESNDCLNF